jgi:hypothetical protein
MTIGKRTLTFCRVWEELVMDTTGALARKIVRSVKVCEDLVSCASETVTVKRETEPTVLSKTPLTIIFPKVAKFAGKMSAQEGE